MSTLGGTTRLFAPIQLRQPPYLLRRLPENQRRWASLGNDDAIRRQSRQVYPLHGYYQLISKGPQSYTTHETTLVNRDKHDEDKEQQEEKEQSPEEKFGIVFGTRLASPGYTSSRYRPTLSTSPDASWRTINGVKVPPRPTEPDNCCMSGCVNCVWDNYRDDLEDWARQIKAAKAKGPEGEKKAKPSPRPYQSSALDMSMDDDGGGSATKWGESVSQSEEEDLYGDIPVGIAQFMKTEKKLKEKQKSEQMNSGQ